MISYRPGDAAAENILLHHIHKPAPGGLAASGRWFRFRDSCVAGHLCGRERQRVAGPNAVGEIRSLHVHDRDVVFASGGIGGVDERGDHRRRIVRLRPDDALNFDRRHHVGQTIRTQKDGGIPLEAVLSTSMKSSSAASCGWLPTSRNTSFRRG